jgi:SAM-dependent methyltransferase
MDKDPRLDQRIRNTNCPLCSHPGLITAYRDMLKCQECGLFIKTEMQNKEVLKKMLQNMLLSACHRPMGPERRMMKAHMQLDEIEKYVDPGRIFDVGAASGFFMKAAQERGWEADGNDISIAAVKWGKQHYNLDIYYDFFEDIELPNALYDAVVMWNTLEHTHDPAETIAAAKRVLKPSGILYIRIPEKGSVEALTKHYEPLHFFEFRIDILQQYLNNQGFEELQIDKNWDIQGVPSTDYLYRLQPETST